MLALALIFALATDTLRVQPVSQPPVVMNTADFASLGSPTAALDAGTSLWLLGDSASVYLVVRFTDGTAEWNDRLVLTLDTNGDRSTAPDHDDFEWDFHRLADSSVIYRGRDGRWQPPRDDPDWRLGHARDGGGWTVREKEILGGWVLIIQLDHEYFTQSSQPASLGMAWFDAGKRAWTSWPSHAGKLPSALPDHPMWWGTVLR